MISALRRSFRRRGSSKGRRREAVDAANANKGEDTEEEEAGVVRKEREKEEREREGSQWRRLAAARSEADLTRAKTLSIAAPAAGSKSEAHLDRMDAADAGDEGRTMYTQ